VVLDNLQTESRRHHVMHVYAYMNARYPYSSNECLRNIHCCIINEKVHYMQWFALCVATSTFLSVHHPV